MKHLIAPDPAVVEHLVGASEIGGGARAVVSPPCCKETVRTGS